MNTLKHPNIPLAARWFVIVWFSVGGLGHFVATDFFVGITPPWVPYPLEMVWLSGVLELAGAIGLLFPASRRWAGWGLLILTLAVSPANLRMALEPELFPQFNPVLLNLRLGLQVFLLACIVWGAGLLNRPTQ
jgi:uncharacterized membrane protein